MSYKPRGGPVKVSMTAYVSVELADAIDYLAGEANESRAKYMVHMMEADVAAKLGEFVLPRVTVIETPAQPLPPPTPKVWTI